MPTIEIPDFDKVETGRELLPAGRYTMTIHSAMVKDNKAMDGKYVNWECIVANGEYAGKHIWFITSLKPAALFKLKKLVVAAGIPYTGMGFNIEDTLGKMVDINVVERLNSFSGDKENDFNSFYPATV